MAKKLEREWMNDSYETQKRRRRNVDLQEERTAKAHPGGTRTKGSGCSQHASRKSDSTGDYFRAENKTTEKRSIVIAHADLRKIRHEAVQNGQQPMLALGFNPGPGRRTRDDWAAFPEKTASYMMRACAALLAGDVQEATDLAELALGEKAL